MQLVYGAMIQQLGCWINNTRVLGLKLLGDFKVTQRTNFHSSWDQEFLGKKVKSKLSPRTGTAALRQPLSIKRDPQD